MSLQIGFRGQTYDDDVPLYLDLPSITPAMVFNRLKRKITTKASLQAAMTAENYHAGAKEIGAMPAAWDATHDGIWDWVDKAPVQPPAGGGAGNTVAASAVTITQAAGLPITGDSSGTKTVTIALGFGGKTLAANAQATITYDVGAGDVTATAALTAGMAGHAAAQAIAAEITKVAELGAAATGSDITVTPTDTTVLSKLTVAIA